MEAFMALILWDSLSLSTIQVGMPHLLVKRGYLARFSCRTSLYRCLTSTRGLNSSINGAPTSRSPVMSPEGSAASHGSRPLMPATKVLASHMYEDMVRSGYFTSDPMQARLLRRLDKLQHLVEVYSGSDDDYAASSSDHSNPPSLSVSPSNGTNPIATSTTSTTHQRRRPRGLYIVGSVGTGKTMAMDLFYRSCSVDRKRRVHFHKFLLEVHARVHAFKKELLQKYGREKHINLSKDRDPWMQVAKKIASESRLLCFDEFQVTDIADAVIMTKLFGVLWAEGVVLVATSNRSPSELYENGLNREYFLPFISMLEEQCVVFDMKSNVDYRKRSVKKEGSYFAPLTPENLQQMRTLFLNYDSDNSIDNNKDYSKVTDSKSPSDKSMEPVLRRVEIMNNRYIDVEAVGDAACWVSFRELCFADRGASDYAALCRLFDCIFIEGITKLNVQNRDVARRFVTLIDEVYDAGTRIVWTGEGPPLELFEGLFKKTANIKVDVIADDITPFDPMKPGEVVQMIDRTVHHGVVTTSANFQDKLQLNEAKYSSAGDSSGAGKEAYSASSDNTPASDSDSIYGADSIAISKGESASYTDLNLALQRAASRLVEMSGVSYQGGRR